MGHYRNIAHRPSNRSYPGGDDGTLTPPHDESRPGKGEKAPRKRNSVACARCRKRKIKCTGDLGDGNGCEACQAAGTNPSSCFYLRVNSHQLGEYPLQSTPEPEWPYSATTSAGFPSAVPRSTTDPGQYALAGGSMLSPSTNIPLTIQASGRAPNLDTSSMAYGTTIPRQSFSSQFPPSLDSTSSQYGLQPSRHGPPFQLSQAAPANFSTAEYSSQWNSIPANSRPVPSSYPFEAEIAPSYQSTEIPYLPQSGLSYSTGGAESSSIFPGLSPLASTLPFNGSGRILPNPTNVPGSMHNSSGPLIDNEVGLDNYAQQFAGRGSISSATRDVINASEGSQSTASSSPSETHRSGSNAGQGSLAYSSYVGSNASASSLPSGSLSRRMSNEEICNTGRSGLHPAQPSHSHLPNLGSSYNLQGMQGTFAAQNSSVNSLASGRSMLGSVPEDIHHPQPQSSSHDMPSILRSTLDTTSGDPRRRSNSKSKGHKFQGKR
ncbi:hypothetical protein ACLMJK_008558 [Lecanora helva]